MAKVTVLNIRMSRKISDDNYGSFGVEAEIELEMGEDDDKDEMWAYGTSWLSAKLTGTHKSHGTLSSETSPEAKVLHTPVAQDAQQDVVQATVKEAGLEGDTSEYTNIKGKPHKLCTIHNEWMPERSNEKGKWYSHKDGDDWCKGE